MIKCNDSLVTKMEKPIAILSLISGKIEKQGDSENNCHSSSSFFTETDFGITGYMYCYAKMSEIKHFDYDTQFRNKEVIRLLNE